MIEFHLSQTLAKDLKKYVQEDRPASSGAMQWYAHRVTVAHRKCIIAMELHSRYAMVFCGLTKAEFEHFPDIFQDRLWREVISICGLDDEDAMAELSDLVLNASVEQKFFTGNNRSVQSHITQVADELAWMVSNDIYALPEQNKEAFAFGLRVNEMLRTVNGKKQYFQPYCVFRDFWLAMLKSRRHRDGEHKPAPEPGSLASPAKSNVIRVDFSRPKKPL